MFRSLLRNTGYALVFIGFFFLHGVNEYPGLIPYSVLSSLFLKYVLIAVGITLFSGLLFRKEQHAFLFGLLLLTFYFFFGSIHDGIKSIAPEGFFRTYRFFLPLMAIVTFGVFLLLWFRKPAALNPTRYFRYLLLLFLLIESGTAAWHLWKPAVAENDIAGDVSKLMLAPEAGPGGPAPDVFFIVLDEYASSASLKQEFNYDNSALDSMLRSNQFFISGASRSNYNVTPFSLASTFSMDYLEKVNAGDVLTSKKFVQAMETYRNNRILSYFRGKQYQIRNFGCFDVKGAELETIPFFVYAYPKLIDDRTAWPRLKREVGWHFTMNDLFGNGFRIPENFRQTKEIDLNRNKYNFSSLLREMQRESASPRFVIAHLLLPHEPFYLHADGSEVSDTLLVKGGIDEKKAYLEQVQYTNRLLAQLMPYVAPKGQRPRVVIIEGDHGYRSFGGGNASAKEFPNLNAYYFSDGDHARLYDGISPVNSFRVVLNKYFRQKLPMLKDSSVYIVNPSGSLEK